MPTKSVLIAGATGLVGRSSTRRLLEDPAFDRVVILTRRPIPHDIRRADLSAKIEEHVIDFDALSEERHGAALQVDVLICCLGTTIKRAGSKNRFREIDYGYPKAMAEIGYARGVRHFLLVSAIGADPGSRIFYNRVKGEAEKAVLAVPLRSVTILRPSLLLGDRAEFRLGEEAAKRLGFLFPRKYRPIRAEDVATVLWEAARVDDPGRRVLESADIQALAREHRR